MYALQVPAVGGERGIRHRKTGSRPHDLQRCLGQHGNVGISDHGGRLRLAIAFARMLGTEMDERLNQLHGALERHPGRVVAIAEAHDALGRAERGPRIERCVQVEDAGCQGVEPFPDLCGAPVRHRRSRPLDGLVSSARGPAAAKPESGDFAKSWIDRCAARLSTEKTDLGVDPRSHGLRERRVGQPGAQLPQRCGGPLRVAQAETRRIGDRNLERIEAERRDLFLAAADACSYIAIAVLGSRAM